MTTEEKISRLEGAYEQVDKRLDGMNRSISDLRGDLNTLRNDMNSRFNQVDSRFNQQLAVIGAAWATLLAGLLAVLFTI